MTKIIISDSHDSKVSFKSGRIIVLNIISIQNVFLAIVPKRKDSDMVSIVKVDLVIGSLLTIVMARICEEGFINLLIIYCNTKDIYLVNSIISKNTEQDKKNYEVITEVFIFKSNI